MLLHELGIPRFRWHTGLARFRGLHLGAARLRHRIPTDRLGDLREMPRSAPPESELCVASLERDPPPVPVRLELVILIALFLRSL